MRIVMLIRDLAGLWAAVLLCTGCGGEPSRQDASPAPVQVETVRPRVFERIHRGVGTVRAAERVEIRPDAAGHVREIRFTRGTKVGKGDVLFVIDHAELEDRLAARRAELENLSVRLGKARRTRERVERAYGQGAATIEERDRVRSDVEGLEAEEQRLKSLIDLIGEQLRDTRVRAPLGGTMSDHRVDVGDFVSRGDLLATLFSDSALEVRFTLGQQAIVDARTGQSVRLTADTIAGGTFLGTVAYVAPSVDASTRQLPVVAVLDDPDGLLRPGVFVSVELISHVRRDVPSVPEEALIATREGYQVFVVKNGRARRREVEVGLRRPGLVEVRRGLDVGERVVRTGHMRLKDGQAVRVTRGPATATAPAAARTRASATMPATRSAGDGDTGEARGR